MSRRRRKRYCEVSTFTHVTREDGRVVGVSRELVWSGPIRIYMNGIHIAEADEVRLDLPIHGGEHEPQAET